MSQTLLIENKGIFDFLSVEPEGHEIALPGECQIVIAGAGPSFRVEVECFRSGDHLFLKVWPEEPPRIEIRVDGKNVFEIPVR